MFAPAAAIGGNLLDSPSALSLILLVVVVVVVLHMCESGVNVGLGEGVGGGGVQGGPWGADGGGTLSWSSSLMSVD